MTDPGWYQAQGDPAGIVRWWNGTEWVGEPTSGSPSTPASIPPAPGSAGAGGHRPLASVGKRLGGRAIDFLIVGVFAVVMFVPVIVDVVEVLGDLPSGASDSEIEDAIEGVVDGDSLAGRLLWISVIGFIWDTAFTALKGGTPGKLMVGTRVVDATSRAPAQWKHAALRALNRLLGLVGLISVGLSNAVSGIGALIAIASLIMLFAHNERRTVMDLVGGTVVVDK